MRSVNYISKELSNHPEFLNELDRATESFFNDERLEVLHKKINREIRAYRDDTNRVVYVLDRTKKGIHVTLDQFYDFNEKNSTKQLIGWQYKEESGKIGEDLHMMTVFLADKEERIQKKNIKTNLFKDENEYVQYLKLETSYDKIDESEKEKVDTVFKGLVINLKILYGEDFFNNPEFTIEFLNRGTLVTCANDAYTLKEYTVLLNKLGFLPKVYDDDFFLSLNRESFKEVEKNLPEWAVTLDALIVACEKQKFTSVKKAFEFNDSDNHVWTKGSNLILTSQNVGFYFDYKDHNNYTVYLLEKEYQNVSKEIKRIENDLANNTVNRVKDIVLEVKDGKVTCVNDSLMYCFELDLEYSGRAMEECGFLERTYPVDITSYEYQKNYYYHRYGVNEFEFVAQAVLTLGGGFDYDKEAGSFVDRSIKYLPKLKNSPETRDKVVKSFNYCLPKKITHLNSEWLDGVKYLVEVLKRDKPIPIAYEGDDENDAIEKAVRYLEIKIKKCEESKPQLKIK